MLVDAEQATQEAARDLLRTEGYTVMCANDGAHALKVIDTKFSKVTPIAIIIDTYLPQLSGYELVRRLTPQFDPKKVPFLMTNKHPSAEDQIETSNLGAHGPLQKPLTLKAFNQLMENIRMRNLKTQIGDMIFGIA